MILAETDLTGIPVQYQVYAIVAVQGFKWLSELYSSIRAGGGLKRIIFSFWLGEGLPKVIADDYRKELQTTPILPPKT